MALAHAILALLVDSPHTGYELAKEFDGSVGYFWNATHQQIYRELAKLEGQGWVRVEVIPQEGRPDRKRHSITDLGLAELSHWVATPGDIAPMKDDLLVKMFVGNLVPRSTMMQELTRHQHLHEERLAFYRQVEQKFFPEVAQLSQQDRFRYLTLRRGIRYEQDWIAWCAEVLAAFEEE